MDTLNIGGKMLKNRLFIGTGKFGDNRILPEVIKKSGAEVITMAVRRVNLDSKDKIDNILEYIPKDCILLPNTSGARNAEEAIRIARIAKAMGCGNWIKIEIVWDNKYLLPDNEETIKATKILSKEGFVVLPYMNPDLIAGKKLIEAGAQAVMPLGSPIGTNRGIKTEEIIQIMIDELDIPIIVDAGIGRPSDACYAMEMGASAVLVNTAIATSDNPIEMAEAFSMAVKSGRKAYNAKLGKQRKTASPSSPLLGFLSEGDAN
ncbi:thiazole-phosphate synthase [Keratinibaculum paraultunense]|uniref:Thiazole synthase n=1 Tax=Keratinibaculum paraultunense TaxID=1278232 RepID=A0A4R3KXS6_9FIRM|nr:thiazole synthase [Keratinibaculum paraultunense]QQY80237.1 thiazole synthase [Keratinibaculum paraultunense]TCS90750.1 thiazole-phosphate synthase [Keratinibaculum paraultunense]